MTHGRLATSLMCLDAALPLSLALYAVRLALTLRIGVRAFSGLPRFSKLRFKGFQTYEF